MSNNLPTLREIWTVDPNNVGASSEALLECHQRTLFAVKEALTGFNNPWTVSRSSNSSSFTGDASGSANDLWLAFTDLVWATPTANHSWIVLKHPVWPLEILIDLDNSVGGGRLLSFYISYGGNFAGGNLGNRPIATDEITVGNVLNWIGSNVASFDSWIHAWENETGTQSRILVTTSEGEGEGMFLSFDETVTPSDLWTNNRVAMLAFHGGLSGGAVLDINRIMATDAGSSAPTQLYSASNPVALFSAPQKDPELNIFSKKSARINLPGTVANEYITMGNASELDFAHTDPFSLSFWFRIVTRTSGATTLVAKRGSSSPFQGYGIFINGTSSGVDQGKLRIQLISNNPGNDQILLLTNEAFDEGNWHHVVLTYDGNLLASGVNCYVDNNLIGLQVDVDNLSNTISNSFAFSVGATNALTNFTFASFDDLSVHDAELSASDVSTIYNNGNPRDLRLTSLNNNLVGYWLMGDGDDFPTIKDRSNVRAIAAADPIVDRSTSGNNGTPTNMEDGDFSTDTPGGASGFSSKLDGVDEFVSVGNVSELDFDVGDAFSLSVWFKSSAAGAGSLIAKRDATPTSTGYELGFNLIGGLFFQIVDDLGSGQRTLISEPLPLPDRRDGQWHHVLVTKGFTEDVSDFTMYVDGQVSTFAFQNDFNGSGGTAFTNTSAFVIGGATGAGNPSPLDGYVDEVAVWNTVLTAEQAAAVYNSGSPADVTLLNSYFNLVGYWGMGEAYNDGTMTNMEASDIRGDSPGNPLLIFKLGSQNAEVSIGTGDMLTERPSLETPNELDSPWPQILDSSGRDNHGTATNMNLFALSTDTPGGVSTRALDFDGTDDYITVGDVADLKFDSDEEFSISVWINTSDATDQAIVSKLDATPPNPGYELLILGGSGSGVITFQLIESNNVSDIQVNTTSTGWNDGAWHHVVATYDATSAASGINIYVDGAAQGTTSPIDTLSGSIQTTTPLQIGARDLNNIRYDGLIDEVSIFSKELTSDEVTSLYNNGAPTDVAADEDGYFDGYIRAYWKMGDGLGTPALPMIPIHFVSGYGYRGAQGFLTDLYWGTEALDADPGSTYPSDENDRQFAQFHHVILPWTRDSTAPLFGIDENQPNNTFDGHFTGGDDTPADAVTEYFQMRGIDTGAPSYPTYVTWVVQDEPDLDGTDANPTFGGPVVNIEISGRWTE